MLWYNEQQYKSSESPLNFEESQQVHRLSPITRGRFFSHRKSQLTNAI